MLLTNRFGFILELLTICSWGGSQDDMLNSRTRGIYFLANDRVIELVITFLNSFRARNPDIHVCLIPFDDNIKLLKNLQNKYNFSIYTNNVLLENCDCISKAIHQSIYGHYRKLVAWEGPYDEFVYIDIDTVILENIDFVFNKLKYFDIITSLSNLAKSVKWVWKKSIYETSLLTQEQIAYSANTGFIVSKKGALSVESIQTSTMTKILELAPHMEFLCKEQPFLNYLIVSSGKKYSSLSQMLDTDMYPENMVELWAGNKIDKYNDNKPLAYRNGKLRRVFMIHWCGVYQLKKIEWYFYEILYRIGLKKDIAVISSFMPHKKIWRYYRNISLHTS